MIEQSSTSHKGDKSMLSTQLTKNRSAITSFYDCQRKKQVLEYADVPLAKETPRWNQSAMTWRNTSHRYSIPKDNRFKQVKPICSDFIQPQIPGCLGSKSCTFGKGNRKPISEIILRNAKQKPSPDAYSKNLFDESPRSSKHGKSFGIGWGNFEKVYIDHRKDVYSSHFVKDNPPAKYQIRETPGKHKRSLTTYDRLKMYTQKLSEVTRGNPGPIYNVKQRHLHNNIGMNQRSFGFGQRMDLSAPANQNPEAIYKIEGFCHKFDKIKKKNMPRKLRN